MGLAALEERPLAAAPRQPDQPPHRPPSTASGRWWATAPALHESTRSSPDGRARRDATAALLMKPEIYIQRPVDISSIRSAQSAESADNTSLLIRLTWEPITPNCAILPHQPRHERHAHGPLAAPVCR